MGLDRGRETQLFDRQCVYYDVYGKVWELVEILKLQGDQKITEDDIQARSGALQELWGVFDAEKESCYHCEQDQPIRRLCDCYEEVYVDPINVPSIVVRYADDKVLRRYMCQGCLKQTKLQAFVVKKAHSMRGSFRMPNFCMKCFNKQKPDSHRTSNHPTVGDSVAPATKEQMQRAVASSQPTGSS